MQLFMLLQNISIQHADLLLKSTIWIQQHVSSLPKLDMEGQIKAKKDQNGGLALQNLLWTPLHYSKIVL